MYVNPIEILGLSNFQQASSIDIDIIKKSKRRLFADIDLSDDNLYDYHGSKLTKSICERSIEELDYVDKKDFYLYLANNNSLNLFLANGNESFFDEIKQDSIFRLSEFINFISEPFAIRFERALLNAFLNGNHIKVQKILSISNLISSKDINIAFKGVSNHIQSKINDTDKITDEIKNSKLVYNLGEIESLFSSIKEVFPATTINCLPIYFSSQILKIAKSINYLSNAIWSNLDHPELSYKFTEYLLSLNISGIDKVTFENNLEVINRENQKRSERLKNAPLIKKWEDIISYIDRLVIEIDLKKIKPRYAWDITRSKIDLTQLDLIPQFGDDIRNQICISVRNLSISIWNHHNDIKIALEAICFAQSIKVSVETKNKIDNDKQDLLQLEEKYRGMLDCHFCGLSSPDDDSKIGTRIYKENDRKNGQIHFSYFDVNVPRCKSCKQVHSKIVLLYWLYLLSGPIFGGFLWSLFGEAFIFGSIIGLYIAYLLVIKKEKTILKEFKTKDKSISILSSHPIIFQKIREGWKFKQPE
jgi:hypothetical protein